MVHHASATRGRLKRQIIVWLGPHGLAVHFDLNGVDGRIARTKTQLFAVLAGRVFRRAVAELDEKHNVRLEVVFRWFGHPGLRLGPFERLAAVAAELRGGQAIEIIEQHVIAGIGFVFSVAIHDFTAAEASPGVVEFAVNPIENPAIVIGHDALIRFADESLFAFGRKVTASLPGRFVRTVNPPQRQERVVQQLFGVGELAAAHGRGRRAIFPENPVPLRTVFAGRPAVKDRIASALPAFTGLSRRASSQQHSGQTRRRQRFHGRCGTSNVTKKSWQRMCRKFFVTVPGKRGGQR